MRDLLLALLLVSSLPLIIVRPYVGVFVWCVVSLMNPHQMAYGFISSAPVALLVAGSTLIGLLASREPKRLPGDPIVICILLLAFWVSVTTVFALRPDVAFPLWDRTIKMFLMVLVGLALIRSRQRLHALVWILVVSIGFYGVRGGLFTLVTGGGGRVVGPPTTMIGDNNSLAAALIMTLPLMRYLHLQSANRWIRLGLAGAMGLTALSVLGSFSRGALLASVAMFFWMLVRSRKRLMILALGATFAIGGLFLMPESWHDRMNTISDYQEDESAMGRLDAWTFAFNLAVERPLVGGGFRINVDRDVFLRFSPEAGINRAFHSIYFQVLGEHGFVGLGLFLATLALGFFKAGALSRQCAGDPKLAWARDLGAMSQVSLVGYAAGGAFLDLAFFDLFYFVALLPVMASWVLANPPPVVWKPKPVKSQVPGRGRPRRAALPPPRDALP
ncbi:putative O-glycosylation ligase, exosortase A system-associated [Rhodospirillum rubrum]|uniref:O-antigen polymerase n=1 Tax=Rhodospirillum rubrum (strain ATCC 11170 / ATH 1.1.1 / DSM 467 / LMG 4362 / NCIMB 8255 / S1) TaxID=269796 RepID=Q2RPQ6_RHORT|nr:putative O-glycosylation ligase, exosortase A system-associated [Rhodospirillum rubrum]ABC23889.1 O-antigen polymerase [Rhodospirillum rubrum ATCC 11170]AEO49633.1 O-antigen polymerase [Rhodospirillum rubrum F11]MBK5955565.1 O-antigen polymerase [Rhodospirillum rubrum]QXG79835.1 putative O-glycosylation ligase, exosortase A system-associated [Rhodospirillum rubrum]HAP99166.1 putative O-glycosylation ligase, exosortase A system-associated [Rhodospirillum rubrum]